MRFSMVLERAKAKYFATKNNCFFQITKKPFWSLRPGDGFWQSGDFWAHTRSSSKSVVFSKVKIHFWAGTRFRRGQYPTLGEFLAW